MVPAAALMPATPKGAKLANRSVLNAENAITANITSTPSLMMTMTVLTAADSLAPRTSNSAHSATTTAAGTLKTPGVESQGAAERACGSQYPRKLSRSLFTYWLQPTETAAVETTYSRSRQAATPITTTSPSVV